MNRTELAQQVASQAGVDNSQAKAAVDAVFETITDELSVRRRGRHLRLRQVQRRRPCRAPGRQPGDGREDPDRGQQGREVLARQRAEEHAQRLRPSASVDARRRRRVIRRRW